MNQTRGAACPLVLVVLLCGASIAAPAQSTPNPGVRVDSIASQMSLEEKIDYIGGTGFAIRAMPKLHLPAFEMSDGPLGVRSNSRFPSTVYAAGIGLAATWNRELAERVGEGIGRDARARGIHFMLGQASTFIGHHGTEGISSTSEKTRFSPQQWPSVISRACRTRASAPRSSTSSLIVPNSCATTQILLSMSARYARSTYQHSRPQ